MINCNYIENISATFMGEVLKLYKDKLIDENKDNVLGEEPTYDQTKLRSFEGKLYDFAEYLEDSIAYAISKNGEFYFYTPFNYQDDTVSCLNAEVEKFAILTLGKPISHFIGNGIQLSVSGTREVSELQKVVNRDGYKKIYKMKVINDKKQEDEIEL